MWLILIFSFSSSIIQDIEAIRKAGEASMTYFDFDFWDTTKQCKYDLLTSLLTQLSASRVLALRSYQIFFRTMARGRARNGHVIAIWQNV